MSTTLLTTLFRALDLCVIERTMGEESGLRLLTPAPTWLFGVFSTVPAEPGRLLGVPCPFLDDFLPQADVAWHEGQEAVASAGPFTATSFGEESLLMATAICHHDRRLLILRRLSDDADPRPLLQKARELALDKETVLRQVGAVHVPAAAIDRDLKELRSKTMPAELEKLSERLMRSNTELQSALAALPAPPSRHRRQARTK